MRGQRDADCTSCGVTFRASRSDARFCSQRCRQRVRRKPSDTRSGLIAKALRTSRFLVGQVAPSYNVGNRAPVYGLMVPRAAALAELNGFLALPDPFTDAELVSALRAEGFIDYGAPVPESAKGVYAKKRR